MILRFIIGAMFCAMSTLSETIPPYDRSNAIFITEFFSALEDNNFELALSKLQKLNELSGGASIFHELSQEIGENIAIGDAIVFLENDDIDGAARTLKKRIATEKSSSRMYTALRKIDALRRIESYLNNRPFESSDQAQSVLAEIAHKKDFLLDSTNFQKWLGQEQKSIVKQRRSENSRLFREIVNEMDVAIVTDNRNLRAVQAQLLLFIDADNAISLLTGLSSSDPSTRDIELLSDFVHTTDNELNESMLTSEDRWALGEIVAYHLYQSNNDHLCSEIEKFFGHRNPITLAGWLTRAQVKLRKGDTFSGYIDVIRIYKLLKRFDGRYFSRSMSKLLVADNRVSMSPNITAILGNLNRMVNSR